MKHYKEKQFSCLCDQQNNSKIYNKKLLLNIYNNIIRSLKTTCI